MGGRGCLGGSGKGVGCWVLGGGRGRGRGREGARARERERESPREGVSTTVSTTAVVKVVKVVPFDGRLRRCALRARPREGARWGGGGGPPAPRPLRGRFFFALVLFAGFA